MFRLINQASSTDEKDKTGELPGKGEAAYNKKPAKRNHCNKMHVGMYVQAQLKVPNRSYILDQAWAQPK